MLLVVKALSSRGQEIKASAHQFHYGQSKNRSDALVSFLLKSLSYIFWRIVAKKTFFYRLLLSKFMLHNAPK